MLSYGLLFVPLLSFISYRAQKRSIENQESEISNTANLPDGK